MSRMDGHNGCNTPDGHIAYYDWKEDNGLPFGGDRADVHSVQTSYAFKLP